MSIGLPRSFRPTAVICRCAWCRNTAHRIAQHVRYGYKAYAAMAHPLLLHTTWWCRWQRHSCSQQTVMQLCLPRSSSLSGRVCREMRPRQHDLSEDGAAFIVLCMCCWWQ
jgi:hypothetical protein